MTGRERLNYRKRWLGLAVLAGLGLAMIGAAHASMGGGSIAAVPVVAGVVLLAAGALAGQVGLLRCPWCRVNLGAFLMHAGWWRIDPRARYCPYCGAEFDNETDTAGPDPWDAPVE